MNWSSEQPTQGDGVQRVAGHFSFSLNKCRRLLITHLCILLGATFPWSPFSLDFEAFAFRIFMDLFYLRDREGVREGGEEKRGWGKREKERKITCCFTPSMMSFPWLGVKAGSQKLNPCLPHGWQGPRHISHHLVLPAPWCALAGSQNQKEN